jgi:hypothetical protein
MVSAVGGLPGWDGNGREAERSRDGCNSVNSRARQLPLLSLQERYGCDFN